MIKYLAILTIILEITGEALAETKQPPPDHTDINNKFARAMKNNPNLASKNWCEEGYGYGSVGDFNITSASDFKQYFYHR